MSDFKIRKTDQIAIWRAWDELCHICEKPIAFFELEIDHAVAERYLKHPEELDALRKKFRIDESFPGFQINDFCNFAPAHRRPCNGSKSDTVNAWTMVLLEQIQKKLPRVREEQAKLKKQRKQGKALADLEAALHRGDLTEDDVRNFLDSRQVEVEDPLVLTFGLSIEDLYKNPAFTHRNLSYPSLCDWLEQDLQQHLADIIDTPFHYTEASSRNGETLSVRIVFPQLDPTELGRFSRSWWTILEQVPFRILYQTAYRFEFPPRRKVVLQTPVEVTLKSDALAVMDDDDTRKYGRFTVLGYELYDDTERRRETAERVQIKMPPAMRMTAEEIEQQHFADLGGTVRIRNGEGKEETLDFHEYQSLVGDEGELVDVQPVDWEAYFGDLLDWYNTAPPSD